MKESSVARGMSVGSSVARGMLVESLVARAVIVEATLICFTKKDENNVSVKNACSKSTSLHFFLYIYM